MKTQHLRKMLAVVLFVCSITAISAQTAIITEIKGRVEVKEQGASAYTPAAQGQSVSTDAIISTGFKSTAAVTIGNSTLTVQPLTQLSLAEFSASAGAEKVNVTLRTGRVSANVNPPAGGKTDFTVRSPSATASVRGTSFDFDGVNLRVDEGTVAIAGRDRISVYVAAGKAAAANPDTGRTQSPAAAMREDLAPSMPIGVDAEGTGAAAASAPQVILGEAIFTPGFDWGNK
ncbi:FecR family protein [Leadbettera azotonutricia]|uniref:FecR family protein n=1 Tax=Leadbettera azotonutricia TaxID=150829 RepID=UPI0002E2CCBC|nr:FecR family protein [Leadbettera azotonutricia]